MKIAISGVTGLIGSTLKNYSLSQGHDVCEITRHKNKHQSSRIFLDWKNQSIDAKALEGCDVVIHLAGANISSQKWTAAYKKEILDSRVESTRLLADAIKKMNRRPKLFLCASAVGFYGHHESEVTVNERSSVGRGFLADVCQRWEEASVELVLVGVRMVHMRFGVVLSKKGGALAKMALPFYLGLGGRLGSGKQKMSWIALDEIPRIVNFIMNHNEINGPVNFVSPHSVTNGEFTRILGSVIHRPTIIPVPGVMVKALFGQMGQELLLEGAHVVPQVLLDAGYRFEYSDLKEALKKVL